MTLTATPQACDLIVTGDLILTLDPKDSYESEWVGWNGPMSMLRTSGDGTPVVGLVGKIVGTETTGTFAAAEIAFPRSIALPPPIAITPSPACSAAAAT